jgi:hypothetical protein
MTFEGVETVNGAFAAAAGRWPGRGMLNVLPETAGIYGIPAGEISYGTAAQIVDARAKALAAAGYAA